MKIQDIAFFIVLLGLLYKRDSKITVIAGLLSLFLAIPLFYFQIFFTAQHLIWYALAFFTLSVGLIIFKEKTI